MSAPNKAKQRTAMGTVISDKMDKTVVVSVQRLTRHQLYGKVLRRSTKLKAHDQTDECRVGDQVEITECRPLSKDKHWRVSRVLTRAK